VELVAICDNDETRIQSAKEKFQAEIAYFDNAEAMLVSGLINACLIAVPHYDHPKYAIACMQRGIHVLVDKPVGVYTKQVKEMNAMADAHPELRFGVMFCLRTIEVYQKLHDLLQSGEYGEMRRMNWIITTWYRSQAYYDSGAWRATWAGEGGAVLMNQCPHQLDLLQWICGMPVKVQSHLHFGKWHDIETEDDATVYMEFANGATGVFVTSTGDACGSNRLEIQTDKARFLIENDVLRIDKFDMPEPEFTKTNKNSFAHPQWIPVEIETDGQNPQHVGVINAFGGAILRGEPLVRSEEHTV
jgi:predicted dehydrogenase